MSVLDDTLKKHRRRIIDREEQAFRELLDAYSGVERGLKRAYLDLQKKILAAQSAGETISPSWLYREQRLKSLIDQVKTEIERFGGTAAAITAREQQAAIGIAVEQTRETFRVIMSGGGGDGIGTLLPTRAVETAVGMMGDGTPILEYYRQNLAPKVAKLIRSEVIIAAATGTDFNTLANRLVKTGQITKSRALSVARTEVNRVRRETSRQILEETPGVQEWEWVASKSRRTCPVCLEMDGRRFKVEEPFPQHVNCRCQIIAVIDGVDRPKRTIGREWFDEQSGDVQDEILGKEAAAAYRRGDVTLKDFVGWKNDKQFGKSVYRKPLAKVLADTPAPPKAYKWSGDPIGISAKELAEASPLRRTANELRAQVESLYRGRDGFVISGQRAATTNSHYLALQDADGRIAKMRISDHPPGRRGNENMLDLRPGERLSDKDLLKKIDLHFAEQRRAAELEIQTSKRLRVQSEAEQAKRKATQEAAAAKLARSNDLFKKAVTGEGTILDLEAELRSLGWDEKRVLKAAQKVRDATRLYKQFGIKNVDGFGGVSITLY